jgi:hypothetical protein
MSPRDRIKGGAPGFVGCAIVVEGVNAVALVVAEKAYSGPRVTWA